MDKTIEDAFTTAVAYHTGGREEEAVRIYRLIITVMPDHPAALNNLALTLPAGEAVELFRQAVLAEPNYVDALVNLSSALQATGQMDLAAVAFDRALALIPDDPTRLFTLAHVLQTQGRDMDAATQYERAIRLKPDFSAALCNLGTLHNQAERKAEAAACYQRALATDPTLEVANLNLVSILEADGRLLEAKQCRARLPRPHALDITPAPDPLRTVLVLANACIGNVPMDEILPKRTNSRIAWHVDFATEEQAGSLPAYDVAFNAVGNADLFDDGYETVSRFAATHPILNHPAAVARTRRDRLPDLLRGIPNLIVPPVMRLSRAEAASTTLVSDLAAAGMTYPVLVRSIAGHGGEGMERIDTPEQMAAFRPGLADAYYVIGYHDLRLADGFYRKYRTIFVDGKPYPYHLAISDHWLVHYFSASMMSAPWKREEERQFLDNPAVVLGSPACAAIAAVGERLGLDFAGIDFGLLPDGQVLVFEANATMLVHLRDSIEDYPVQARACSGDLPRIRRNARSPRLREPSPSLREPDPGLRKPSPCLPAPIALNRALGCARSSIG